MEQIINICSLFFLFSELGLFLIKRSKKGEVKIRKDKQSMLILWLVFIITICSSIYLATLFPRSTELPNIQLFGVAVVIMGFVIRWMAIYQLKDAFTVDVSISKTHKIKQDGMYKSVRHPSYLGLLLELLGLSLLFDSWIPLFLINIPSFIALNYRIKIEEELLTETFGEDYKNYISRTKKILPGIY